MYVSKLNEIRKKYGTVRDLETHYERLFPFIAKTELLRLGRSLETNDFGMIYVHNYGIVLSMLPMCSE